MTKTIKLNPFERECLRDGLLLLLREYPHPLIDHPDYDEWMLYIEKLNALKKKLK